MLEQSLKLSFPICRLEGPEFSIISRFIKAYFTGHHIFLTISERSNHLDILSRVKRMKSHFRKGAGFAGLSSIMSYAVLCFKPGGAKNALHYSVSRLWCAIRILFREICSSWGSAIKIYQRVPLLVYCEDFYAKCERHVYLSEEFVEPSVRKDLMQVHPRHEYMLAQWLRYLRCIDRESAPAERCSWTTEWGFERAILGRDKRILTEEHLDNFSLSWW